jgi:dTDP-4-amino-4,6-dideoxygalactose transaminase
VANYFHLRYYKGIGSKSEYYLQNFKIKLMNNKKISFSPPDITDAEVKEVAEALKSGWITTGPRTKMLEAQVATLCNTDRAVCLNSATACMEAALRVLGVGPGDEVIVPAYTYTATASVVTHVGAQLVMIDCAPDSFEIDYDKLADLITEKTKVVMPVDLGGVVCNYDKVFAAIESKKHLFRAANEIQKNFGRVVVLADAAHAFGAQWHGKMCGEIADFTSFSFHAVKNFTTAEGGALTWVSRPGIDNEAIYKHIQLLSLHGQNKDALAKTKLGAWEYDIVAPYYKSNMTDIMAAIGLVQMKRYPDMLDRRKVIIDRYNETLKPFNVQVLNHFGTDHRSCGHLYLVRLLDKTLEERNEIITKMAERGIACNVHYKPLPMMTAYKNLGFDIKDYPNAFNQFYNEITLPLHTSLKDDDVEYVISNFINFIR